MNRKLLNFVLKGFQVCMLSLGLALLIASVKENILHDIAINVLYISIFAGLLNIVLKVNFRPHISYFKYVVRHKWFVLLAGLQLRVPLLILIFHDWDKFLPDEWIPYTKTFYDKNGNKQYKEYPDFSVAWNAHQKRNKHHWQYWLITWDRGETEALPMPDIYRREMVADWMGAGRALGFPNTWEWYEKNKNNIQIHPMTRIWVEEQMAKLKFISDWRAKRLSVGEFSVNDIISFKKDADAIGLDWTEVGKDIQKGIDRYNRP